MHLPSKAPWLQALVGILLALGLAAGLNQITYYQEGQTTSMRASLAEAPPQEEKASTLEESTQAGPVAYTQIQSTILSVLAALAVAVAVYLTLSRKTLS